MISGSVTSAITRSRPPLHRITFTHPLSFLDAAFSIPPAAGFSDLDPPDLLGLARGGGYQTVNSAFVLPSAASPAGFEFESGSNFRNVMAPGAPTARPDGVLGFASLAGGSSGDPASPLYASQLGSWLTVDYHRVPMNRRDVRVAAERVELFEPPAP